MEIVQRKSLVTLGSNVQNRASESVLQVVISLAYFNEEFDDGMISIIASHVESSPALVSSGIDPLSSGFWVSAKAASQVLIDSMMIEHLQNLI